MAKESSESNFEFTRKGILVHWTYFIALAFGMVVSSLGGPYLNRALGTDPSKQVEERHTSKIEQLTERVNTLQEEADECNKIVKILLKQQAEKFVAPDSTRKVEP